MKIPHTILIFALAALFASPLQARQNNRPGGQGKVDPERAAILRGSITPERQWWDLLHYHLSVQIFPEQKKISGSNEITFRVLENGRKMQIDLQQPLEISSITHGKTELNFRRVGNVYWIEFAQDLVKGEQHKILIEYSGKPKTAKRPPWDGGLAWDEDEKGNPFIATACQGIGASIWWPCKDHGYDEPDDGMRISITCPQELTAVSNGRLEKTDANETEKTKTFHWVVTQPINNYCINMNVGNYVNFSDKYSGRFGELDLDYWVLEHQRETAVKHFREVPRTIEAFEHWFGKYPFYEDSFKIVVVPYLGMEHQSSVTYGNGFQNGYNGTDLSNTGVGLKFDFIIVHESGHEWWGNNVSMKDAADMWIHESFTNYSENLFVEYHFTQAQAEDYVVGCRRRVQNDRPIIGTYNRNKSGSGDMYYKGGNMLHAIRHIINDDEKWKSILRGIQQDFWHQTVTTQQIEDYISEKSEIDFGKFFDQYLRGTAIPVLSYHIDGDSLTYQYTDVVEGFSYPLRVKVNGKTITLTPTGDSQTLTADAPIEAFELDRNFYVLSRNK